MRRFIRAAIRWLNLPLILALLVLIRIGLPRRKVHVVVMDSRYFGHQCLEPEVFWNDKYSSAERGSRDIWLCCIGPKSTANSKFMWELQRERLPTVPSWLVTDAAFWQERFGLSTIEFVPASIYRLNFLTSRPTSLPSDGEISRRRSEILRNLHEPERPYVVFTVREWIPEVIENDLRNRRIEDFGPAMAALVQRGFNVIRLTSRTSDRLTANDGHTLDWQVLIDGEPGDELAVVSGASFIVSTTTGGDCLALAYRRPVLFLDSARLFFAFFGTELATIHMPKVSDSKSAQRLSLKDVLERNLGWVGDQRCFGAAGVTVMNSTPEEIRGHVLEYVEFLQLRVADGSGVDGGWRSLVRAFHGEEIQTLHGDIRARMHPVTRREVVGTLS